MQRGHVGLHEAGAGDKALCPAKLDSGEINTEHLQPVALCPAKLDSGEINTEHLQPVAGQLTGCRYPGPATEVNNPGSGPQQASQFRHPAGVASDVLCGGGGRIAIITAIGQRNRIITAADKSTPTRPLNHVIVFHHGHLATRPHHRHHRR